MAAEYGQPSGEVEILPLVYQSEEVGQLVVAPRTPGEGFAPADKRLLDDLAHQAGAAAHAARLTADLQSSRERLVNAREEERRRLRRDLHDGLGPTLGGLTLGLDTARGMVTGKSSAEQLLVRLKEESQEAVSDVRRLVYGLRPPALDDLLGWWRPFASRRLNTVASPTPANREGIRARTVRSSPSKRPRLSRRCLRPWR